MASYKLTMIGRAELKQRQVKLSSKQRALLFFLDDGTSAEKLGSMAATLGLPSNFLAPLLDLRLIEPVTTGAQTPHPPAAESLSDDSALQYRVAHQFMNETVVDALGIRSFLFVLKLEKCSTLDDLRKLAPHHTKAIAGATSTAQAKLVHGRLLELLR